MRLLRVANFVTPTSGGIRTALGALAREYAACGVEPLLLVPGRRRARRRTPEGVVATLPGLRLPGTDYRVLVDRAAVRAAVQALAPDAVEVHDRFTLAWLVPWLRGLGVPATLVVHERLLTPLRAFAHLPGVVAAPTETEVNRRLADAAGPVVVASRSVARTFPDGGAEVVPLGVDRAAFPPASVRPDDAPVRLALVGRLSVEKAPAEAIDAATILIARGHDVHLDVLGDGPLRTRLERRAPWTRTTFHGHVARDEVARVVAGADAVLAPCPTEAFGLAALEALASGVPVVAHREGAVPELLGLADGVAAASDGSAPRSWVEPRRREPLVAAAGAATDGAARDLAAGVEAILAVPPARRRVAALDRAARYPWAATAAALLARAGLAATGSADSVRVEDTVGVTRASGGSGATPPAGASPAPSDRVVRPTRPVRP